MVGKVPWLTRLEHLKEFKKLHGHCGAPTYDKENKKLGLWVKAMRKEYKKFMKGEDTSLTCEQVGKLNDLGFEWKLLHQAKVPWQTRFEQLKEFKTLHGHCRVTKAWNLALYNWVIKKRQFYVRLKRGQKSPLTEEQITELNSLGFDWKPVRGRKKKTAPEIHRGHEVSTMEIENNQSKRPRDEKKNLSSPNLENQPSAKKRRRMSQEDDSTDTESGEDGEDEGIVRHTAAQPSGLGVAHYSTVVDPQIRERLRAKWEGRSTIIAIL